MADDFCKKFMFQQEKYMFEDKKTDSLYKIGCGSVETNLKTAFSFASTLTFHYLCQGKFGLKEKRHVDSYT